MNLIQQSLGGLFYGSNWQASPSVYGGSGNAADSRTGAGYPSASAFAAQQTQQAAALQALADQSALFGLGSRLVGALPYGDLSGHALNNIPAREPIENTGIELGEVYAWRCWAVDKKSNLLMSCVVDNVWVPGEPMIGKPDDWGLKGVNAFKTASAAITQYGRSSFGPVVSGQVMLWGGIIEHEDGYRAEYGLPVSLDRITPDTFWTRRRLRRLRRKYFPQDSGEQ